MRELASLEKGKIEPNSDFQWRNELLYIPPIPPTNLRGCNLIRIQYDVYVSAIQGQVCGNSFLTSYGNTPFRP